MAQKQTALSETGEIVRESVSVLEGQEGEKYDNTCLYDMLVNINGRLSNMNERLKSLEYVETRLAKIELSIQQLAPIEDKLSKVTGDVERLGDDIGALNKSMADFRLDLTGLSNLFDEVNGKVHDTAENCDELKSRVKSLEEKLETDANARRKDRDELLNMKCRSMQNNLVFLGIKEASGENCELIVKTFIRDTMKLSEDVQFDRVHRLNVRQTNRNSKPRAIVAAFTRFRDREMVRLQAPKTLRDTTYGVYEQLPPEILEKRRHLYPVLKEARERGDHARFVRGDLLINNVLYREPRRTPNPDAGETREAKRRRNQVSPK